METQDHQHIESERGPKEREGKEGRVNVNVRCGSLSVWRHFAIVIIALAFVLTFHLGVFFIANYKVSET